MAGSGDTTLPRDLSENSAGFPTDWPYLPLALGPQSGANGGWGSVGPVSRFVAESLHVARFADLLGHRSGRWATNGRGTALPSTRSLRYRLPAQQAVHVLGRRHVASLERVRVPVRGPRGSVSEPAHDRDLWCAASGQVRTDEVP